MAEELYTTDAREQKAWKRVLAATKKLAKAVGDAELAEAVSSAYHPDVSTRDMRRTEALAALLEALIPLVDADEPTKPATASTTASKSDGPAVGPKK